MNDEADKEKKYKEMYKKELELIEKYIDNKYIYDIILRYETKIGDKIYKLHSNINVYEMVFLGKMCETINARDIMEIGCAFGTSGMVLVNALIKKGGGKLISVDPFQSIQWNSVGVHNINKIIDLNKTNKIVNHELMEDFSSKVLDNFVNKNKYFDLIFVDGSHAFTDVIIDIFCSIKLLKKGGLMILDDVLHTGVKLVVNELKHFSSLEKVHFDEKFNIIKSSYEYLNFDKSYMNPRTMYAYRKI